MIYISHLVLDVDMKALVKEYGTGIESIDFSISDNLDQLSNSIKTYWEKMKEIGTRDLILHGPFLDVNPCAYDSLVREATMTRFNQCYEPVCLLQRILGGACRQILAGIYEEQNRNRNCFRKCI